ncbi:MAG: type IV pilin protein [Steroidobacteraceae bacterium]
MRGFSLIELLVTLAIAAVLAALALPGYSHVINRALRQDARLALLRIQHRQEGFFANHLIYSATLDNNPSGLAMPARSDNGYYLLELQTSADGTAYTALARADPGGRQATDLHCMQLSIDATGRRRSADAANNWRDDDPWRCWG